MTTMEEENLCCRWVDYLPSQIQDGGNNMPDASLSSSNNKSANSRDNVAIKKRASMDPSESNTHETSCDMDLEDWPDSGSLEGMILPPDALLLDHDPVIQQELMLFSDGSSMAPELFANSLEELLEQRRSKLAASMQASMRTRQVLGPHIRQRAGLSNVLTQIERSSMDIHQHLLHQLQQQQVEQQRGGPREQSGGSGVPPPIIEEEAATVTSDHSVDMSGVMAGLDQEVEDFAASVLADDLL